MGKNRLPNGRGKRAPACLAKDCEERAISWIRSGMGSDGAQGLRAIKEKAGGSFVQVADDKRSGGNGRAPHEPP